MRSNGEHNNSPEPTDLRDLQLLSEVEQQPELSQRELSQRLGIALGLTNILLRNLVQKGYVRAAKAGWKRWFYNLTPEGVTQKIKLTVTYVHRVLNHYQKVRRILIERLEPLALHEESRIAVYGTGEFAELVYLGLKEYGVQEIQVFLSDPEPGLKFLGMPVHDISELRASDHDQIVVALLSISEERWAELNALAPNSDHLITFFDVEHAKEAA